MTTKEFIEKAIKGGWSPLIDSQDIDIINHDEYENTYMICDHEETICTEPISYYETLLDPKAWEAVGKAEGDTWAGYDCRYHPVGNMCQVCTGGNWSFRMKAMMDALIESKTIEEYLATL